MPLASRHKQQATPASVWRNPIHFLAFGFGSGALPWAPGTFGTLVAIPLFLLLAPLPLWAYLSLVAVLTVLGVWLCQVTSRDLGVHDHAGIVWDEIVGYLITMIAIPATWPWLVTGFVLFRLFDIIKPWPIGWADHHVHGGLGIMLDDVLAAVYAGLIMQLLLHTVG
jgi:phosphatidylglycerophosphatase A